MNTPERNVMIKFIGISGREWQIETATAQGYTFVKHEDLKDIADKEKVEVEFDSLGEDGTNAYAMCWTGVGGMHFGMVAAPSMLQAFRLAYDEAIIDLYGLNAKSYDEYLIWRAAKAKKA